MARTPTAATALPPTDPTLISLTRLLARLDSALLSPSADPTLRSSQHSRTRVGANLEHARTLLLRLEHDAAALKIQSRKQALQADLSAKRDTIKQLNQRLYELNQLGDTDDDDEDEEDEEENEGRVEPAEGGGSANSNNNNGDGNEDGDESSSSDEDDAENLPSYAPAHRDTSDTLDREHRPASDNPALYSAAENVASALRARRPGASASSSKEPHATATTSASASASATTTGSSPFNSNSATNSTNNSKLHSHESHMTHHRTEQESLTSSLLDMAQALKQSSIRFSSSLESEKDVLNRAGKGLDRSAEGMESAGQRMGTLRRMTEGKGWWGRVIMYAWIGGLWIVVLVIMFVLPKLRF